MVKSFEIQDYLFLAIKLILILSIINAIYLELWHIMSTNIFLLILLLLPSIIKRKYQINLPKEFGWLLLLFIISTFFIGRIKGAIVPIFFGIAIGFIGFMILLILYLSNQIKKNYFLIILFSFNFAVAFGFALEFLKYYLKILLNHQLTPGLYKLSMTNMTYVIIGATIASLIGFIYMKNKGILKPVVQKFIKSNPKLATKADLEEEILELIKNEENEKLEFKSTLRLNLHTNEIDRKIEYATLKTITAFLNSNGGTILIGVSDSGEILGIEKDRFENNDKLKLHLTNIIKEKIGNKFLHLIDYETMKKKEKIILIIKCKKSNQPVFFRPTKDEEEFYIRVGPSRIQIKGSELIEYIKRRFAKSSSQPL